eukprot:7634379-Pyramimonas_sp.AAC.1
MTIHWGLSAVKFSEGSEKFCTPCGSRSSWVGTGTPPQRPFRIWAGFRNLVVASPVQVRTRVSRLPGGGARLIIFVMYAGLVVNVLSCEVSRKTSVKPHWPVAVKFEGRSLDEKINILRLPR